MKILVFLYQSDLKHAGGPSGYWFNIYQEIQLESVDSIDFLRSNKQEPKRNFLYYLKRVFDLLFFPTAKNKEFFSKYDVIHFQTVMDLYEQRRSLKKYHGIVVLTSHTPVPPQDEMIDEFKKKHGYFGFCIARWFFSMISKKAFLLSDFYLFPCPEAEEPYIKYWAFFRRIKKERPNSFLYLPTGIIKPTPLQSRESVRERYGIGINDFVVCFVGRHNKVKGYDLFQEIAEPLLEGGAVKVLVAGKPGPVEAPQKNNWIEAGWADSPSIMNASDVFVLPNRDTYFDLALIEAAALGKIIVASRTGGNIFFEKRGASGIMLYSSVSQAQEILKSLKKLSQSEIGNLGRQNIAFFEKNLTARTFLTKYLSLMKLIIRQ